MNVRHFVAKHVEIMEAGSIRCDTSGGGHGYELVAQHLRFQAEARIAAPLEGVFGWLTIAAGDDWRATDRETVRCLTELRHAGSGKVLSTCIHYLKRANASMIPPNGHIGLPDYAQPRGVAAVDPDYILSNRATIDQLGFRLIGAGVAQPTEVGADGKLLTHNYMGRLSDAMPHFWPVLGGKASTDEGDGEGGAILEYRLRYHAPLLRGGSFEIRSGLLKAGSKVQVFAHLMHDPITHALLVSAEACGVRMNLRLRKAIELSADRVAQMQQLELDIPI